MILHNLPIVFLRRLPRILVGNRIENRLRNQMLTHRRQDKEESSTVKLWTCGFKTDFVTDFMTDFMTKRLQQMAKTAGAAS